MWIDGYAMTPDCNAGLVDVAERLTVRRSDHLGNVGPERIGVNGKFVGEGDVDVAVGGLGQLREFGRLDAGQRPDAVPTFQVRPVVKVEDRLVELHRRLGRRRIDATDQLRVLAKVGEDPARTHPFGAVAHEEVLACDQPAQLGQPRGETVPGGADWQGRLVTDQRARLQASTHGFRYRVERREVALTVVVDDQRNDDDDDIRFGHHRLRLGARLHHPVGDNGREPVVEVVLAGKRRRPCIYQVDDRLVDVGADDTTALAGDLDGQRQADLAKANDTDPMLRRTVADVHFTSSTIRSASSTARTPEPPSTLGCSAPRTQSTKCWSSRASGSPRVSRNGTSTTLDWR